MTKYIKQVIELAGELSYDDRNRLSVGYKNAVGAYRSSWRVLTEYELKHKHKDVTKPDVAKDYREIIESEIIFKCNEAIVRFCIYKYLKYM